MSVKKSYNISCPKCGDAQDVELYDSINVAIDPDLKKELFENRLNQVQCASCDANFRVDKPLLYHDPDRDILIHWMPDTAVPREEILDEFDRSMEELHSALPEGVEQPRVRLVFDRVELVELIFIIEAGMDERVIEHIKYMVYIQNIERLLLDRKQLLLNVQDSTADELIFAVRDLETAELEDLLRYPREAYRGVVQMYRDKPEDFIELFPGPYINARAALLEERIDGYSTADDQ